MNGGPGWRTALGAARQALRALAGGAAPRVFRRRLAGSVAALGDLRRGTAWLRELAAVRPRLLSGPLWGGALAELMGGEPPAAEAARPAARRGAAPGGGGARPGRAPRGISPFPATSPARPGGMPRDSLGASASPPAGLTPETTSRRHGPAVPLALAARAGRELLERLAHPVRSLPAREESRRAEPGRRPLPFPASGRVPSPAPNAAAEARWRRDLASGAQQAARREGWATAPMARTGARTGRAEQSPEATAAANPWQVPFAGERAPREVLDRFRGTDRRVRPAAPVSPARPAPTASAASAASAAPEIPPAHRSASPSSGSAPAPHRASPAADSTAETAPLLVPPPSLPPFLGVHGATEVALRRPAAEGPTGNSIPPRVPAILPDDDLASRLDRLLAEEARRHGIDV